jgi:hypothetical protein
MAPVARAVWPAAVRLSIVTAGLAVPAVAVAYSTAGAVPVVRAAPAVPAVETVVPVVRAEHRARLHCGAKVAPVVPVA